MEVEKFVSNNTFKLSVPGTSCVRVFGVGCIGVLVVLLLHALFKKQSRLVVPRPKSVVRTMRLRPVIEYKRRYAHFPNSPARCIKLTTFINVLGTSSTWRMVRSRGIPRKPQISDKLNACCKSCVFLVVSPQKAKKKVTFLFYGENANDRRTTTA